MIWVGLSILVLLAVARLALPFTRSLAREEGGVADVPFDGS